MYLNVSERFQATGLPFVSARWIVLKRRAAKNLKAWCPFVSVSSLVVELLSTNAS